MLAALKYCLSDIEKSEAVEKLEGLPLIPLANGKFVILKVKEKI